MSSFHFILVFPLSFSTEFLCNILERGSDIPVGGCITIIVLSNA